MSDAEPAVDRPPQNRCINCGRYMEGHATDGIEAIHAECSAAIWWEGSLQDELPFGKSEEIRECNQ